MRFIIVGGCCGTGKSTVGRALANKLNYEFIDGDDLHSAANKAKMSKGVGLTGE
jgi:carbohydrate kinase (thermoresistant glucokinase family)